MRSHFLCLMLVLSVVTVLAAPARNALDTGVKENETAYAEEVLVEAVLNVRSPSGRQRQARTDTDTSTNLQDGTRVAEANTVS